ncbi:hypothetical protein SAMD00019534_112450 [Acytostelium subglobosum LB1]|uniref:hypothetical protein n=1 Tax=Acytostelium subglobosum LB1 TaxID=1410327 RepID=UPI000645117C|nr:hypothetical protein SAMD00019534_112450 [Acytostelium subglobosum LB1]GAM28069.1 hypothetical protein SAMD00019534_112450 [Acytostelium subglobosum LB1]|eukprot:XP_012749028.1 hypothetical protein SAMD00019534_112450 [Acytostelium subglobosum LB1]
MNYPNCTTSYQCKHDEVCGAPGQCVLPSPDGGDCKVQTDCSEFSSCLNNKCIAYFSVEAAGTCQGMFECDMSQGLMCIQQTCQSKNVLTNVGCNSSSDCTRVAPYSRCQCNGNSGANKGRCSPTIDPTQVSKMTFINYHNCILNNKCPAVSNPLPDNSCAGKCGNPIDAIQYDPCNVGSVLSCNIYMIITSTIILAIGLYIL